MISGSAAALVLGAWNCPTAEARQARRTFDIPATSLPAAIAVLAREAGVSIGAEGALPSLRTPPVRGELAVQEVLDILLRGSGYAAQRVGATAWRIIRAQTPEPGPENPSPAEFIDGPPIIVTATKEPRDLFAIPAALSVVALRDGQRHEARAGSAEIAGRVDGLSLTALGPGRNRMFLRGVADSAFPGESQATVAIILDEARVTYAAPDPDIRLVDMARAEVLKGPQGSIYGTGALGGIYHLVSRAPQLNEASLDVSAGSTAVAEGAIGYSGSAVLNVPLAQDKAALRLVSYVSEEPGWVDTGPRKDADVTRVFGARAMLGFVPAEQWRVDLTGFAQLLSSNDSRYVYTPHARSRPDQLAEPHDNDLSHLAFRAVGDLGAATATIATAITWHNVGDNYDATVGAEDFGLADPQMLLDRRRYRTWDSELRLRGGEGEKVGWLLGLSHLEARQSVDETLHGASGASLNVDRDRRTSMETGVYGNVSIPLGRGIGVEAGGRLFYAALSERRNLGLLEALREKNRFGFTPSLALKWQPDPDNMVFVKYGSAFRQGGTSEGASGAVQKLDGDELATVEAGFRRRLPDSGQIELSAWYAWWSDIQSDALQATGLIRTVNAGDARIVGAEASLAAQVAASWRVEAGLDVTSALLTRSALGYKLHDRHLPAVPEYTARLALRHDFTIARAPAWIRASMRYLGPSRMSFDPSLDRPMGKVLETGVELHLRWRRMDLALSANNLIGETANTFAYGNPLRYSTMSQFTPSPPFTAAFSAALAF